MNAIDGSILIQFPIPNPILIVFIARLEKLSYDINSETDSNSTSSPFISCAEYLVFSKYSLNNSSMSLKIHHSQ